ncbi:putative ankyrin repeat-containing protein [Aspergillus nomiae NRRL 13137]|uniref:Putative ankyrin repeat-containing protein n=1 Tax=Aspergillus nomiae NRRL (strain ATCC 15546 / NRRL 13137 / CBS 260.88 / M93) TaxID=1509407 RepID=A0A0L1JCC6_ASPN3|nr:putative ankyrin repeat-containing protein [Aspergillus nomiae NRRL 13137]KNG89399.1 putative ankyrin repeat-containing protein [Aspergillus nomiae NRRL 13137]
MIALKSTIETTQEALSLVFEQTGVTGQASTIGMADPLAITGLILQVIETAGQVYRYCKEVKNADNEIRELFGELFALKAVLEQMSKERQGTLNIEDPKSAQALSSESFRHALLSANGILKDILDDLMKRQLRGKSFFKQLGWPGKKEKLQDSIVQLERLKSYFILVMVNESSAMDKEVLSSINYLTDLGTLMRQDSQKDLRQKIREWICPFDVEVSHRKARSVCQAGTGSWFIDGTFQRWFRGQEKSRLLYLEGKSGSGKTVLCSTAIEEARNATQSTDFSLALFTYCSFQLSASQKLVHVLGALLAQLSDRFPQALDVLEPDFRKKSLPSPDILLRILRSHARELKRLYIFVDAVNESDECENIISTLLSLAESEYQIHVMVTSTAASVTLSKDDLLREQMKPSSNQKDIQDFVNAQLETRPSLRYLPPHTKRDITTVLIAKANGMFRYVQCQIDLLSAQATGRGVRKALATLPESLNGTYEVILGQIPPYSRELARDVLLWLTFSRQLITLSALSEAVVIIKGDKFLDDECRLYSPTVILKICQGLVAYDEVTSVITLAHSSVKAFLTSDAIRQGPAAYYSLQEVEATRCIFQKCLTYLMFDAFQKPCRSRHSLRRRLKEFPLLSYASMTWGQYCGLHAPAGFVLDHSELDEIMAFFATCALHNGGNFRSWVQVLIPEAATEEAWSTEPLYYASSFGMTLVVERLIKSGINLDSPGGRHDATALTVASYRGQLAVVKMLLDAGADPNLKDCHGITSLGWAKRKGHREVETLLLAYGAQVQLGYSKVVVPKNTQLADSEDSDSADHEE